MEDHIQLAQIWQRISDVVLDQCEPRRIDQVFEIRWIAGAEIIDADHIGAGIEQRVAEVRSNESSTTEHDCPIKAPRYPAHVWWARQTSGVIRAVSVLCRRTVRLYTAAVSAATRSHE